MEVGKERRRWVRRDGRLVREEMVEVGGQMCFECVCVMCVRCVFDFMFDVLCVGVWVCACVHTICV